MQFVQAKIDGLTEHIYTRIVGIFRGETYAFTELLAEHKLVIVGLCQAVETVDYIRRRKVSEIAIGDGDFVEIEIIGPGQNDPFAGQVAIVIVSGRFSGLSPHKEIGRASCRERV